MKNKITNVNIIASYIYNNPGCRRTDIKRHLFVARCGEEPVKGHHNRTSNQYFQNYGNASNVYLNHLWYNEIKNIICEESCTSDYWHTGNRVNRPGKSSYQLTSEGENWVRSELQMIRPFAPGALVEWQWESPKRHGWFSRENHPEKRGLVIECNKTYGLWVLGLDGKVHFCSHHAYIRSVN